MAPRLVIDQQFHGRATKFDSDGLPFFVIANAVNRHHFAYITPEMRVPLSTVHVESARTLQVHALPFIGKALRIGKLSPAVVAAFVSAQWRSTATFIIRKVHHCRFALHRDEGVVDDHVGGSHVSDAVNAGTYFLKTLAGRERLHVAASVLDCEGAALYRIERIAGMVMPWQCVTGF
jgi:hypothetical protein